MEACNDFFIDKVYNFQISLDVHKSSARIGTLTVKGLNLVVLVSSLDFKSLCMWKSIAVLLFQIGITKDKPRERGGHIGTKSPLLLAEPCLKVHWLSSHL